MNKNPTRSFFLWGPRQSGKSTLLHALYPNAKYIDLLQSDVFASYVRRPALLRELATDAKLIVIDEVQKIPELLDEVHWCIENQNRAFALCGSSARKLKRGHANLLGGRALRYELYGLSAQEIGSDFNLVRMINHGYLPSHYDCSDEEIRRLLLSYVGDYLRDEVAAESLVRNLTVFSDFLTMAALSDSEQLKSPLPVRHLTVTSEEGDSWADELTLEISPQAIPALPAVKSVARHAKSFFDLW